MKRSKRQKPYWKMNADELAEATKEFDREIPADKFQPLTKEERSRWEWTKRQPSRSIFVLQRPTRRGVEAVVLELDRELLRRTDAYAASRGMTRSELIENGLKSMLAFAQATPKRGTRKSA